MATGKRYYYIKLKDSLMTSDAVDYLMSQPDGANYVVLYQMLHLKAINTGGRLQRQIGEVLIPYDVGKIVRDMKWFSTDTVKCALTLYMQLGLIYQDNDGVLVLTDHNNLVGSESDYADQKRQQRMNKAAAGYLPTVDRPMDKGVDIVHTEIRDKEIKRLESRDKEIRDQSIERTATDNRVDSTDLEDSADQVEGNCLSGTDVPDRQTQSVRRALEAWNSLGISPVSKLSSESTRAKMLRGRIREYGIDTVLAAIGKVGGSSFLKGQNKRGWIISFDWFVKPNNFVKVLDGNYDDRRPPNQQGGASTSDRLIDMAQRGVFDE